MSSSDDAAYFNRAKALLDKIISSQSTNVDTVSGATYSSVGLIQAVRDALSKAGADSSDYKEVETKPKSEPSDAAPPAVYSIQEAGAYKDGVYYGTGTGFKGAITVAVTIEGGKIVDISVISSSDDNPYFQMPQPCLQTSSVSRQPT